MADKKGSNLPNVPIEVNVTLQPSPSGETPPRAVVYAFTGTGHFIAKAPVDEKGKATLSVPGAGVARQVRILVGPEIPEKQATVSELTRRGGQEQILRVQPEVKVSPVSFVVPYPIWPCWIRLCLVTGTLLKSVLSAGIPVNFPVCGANVQIYEVEPIEIIIPRLPVAAIDALRQAVINPPVPPPPEDGILSPGVGSIAAASQVALPQARGLQFATPVATVQPTAVVSSAEFTNLQFLAQHATVEEFRQALIANASLIRFIICLLYPTWVTGTLIATVTTDSCGNFQDWIALSCFYPSVNLYFTASVNYGGIEFQIYDPTPISCFTNWDYQCGTQVTLYTDSALAPCCNPCPPIDAPENYVLFRAIGNVPLSGIYGTSTLLAGVTTSANMGLAADLYFADIDSPFGNPSGDAIYPRVEFDSSLLTSAPGAAYYQISLGIPGSGGTFTYKPLTGAVYRYYNQYVGGTLVTSPYNLGPQVVNGVPNLFAIPPELPPVGGWVYPNPPVDLANAVFDSSSLSTAGQYRLKLDLFDSSGNPVNIAAAGITYYVPTTTDPDGTIHTADASTLGLVSGNSFIMPIYIDNNPTSANLPIPTLDGNPPDPTCGLLQYPGPNPCCPNTGGAGSPGGTVTVQYYASQPENFAAYAFNLSRGVNPLTPPSTGQLQVSAASNPATVSMTTASLLGGCAIAGFGEDIYVWSTATDGWNRLSGYDSNPPPVGFVLAPPPAAPCPPTGT